MGYDNVPWMIGGGAEHSPEVGRLIAFAASGGAEGVVSPGDLKVTALGTPGAAVTVGRGALIIHNRFTSNTNESYVVRMATPENAAIAATGAGVTRRDLIATIITDPFVAGSTHPIPTDRKVGPYVKTVVIPNVAASVTRLQDVPAYATATGYALAMVTVPPSTSAITNAMITNLRVMGLGRTQRRLLQVTSPGDAGASAAQDALTSTVFIRWPNAAQFQIDVPSWATHAIIRGTVSSYAVKSGATTGRMRASGFGGATPHVSFDENWDGGQRRTSLSFGGEVAIAPQYRGTRQPVNFDGLRSQASGFLDADAFTNSMVDVQFEERAE